MLGAYTELVCECMQSLSHVWLFVTYELWPTMLLCLWNCPGKNTGVGCHFLLQGIFPTQGLNLCLLHWQADSLPLNYVGSPILSSRELKWCIRSPNNHWRSPAPRTMTFPFCHMVVENLYLILSIFLWIRVISVQTHGGFLSGCCYSGVLLFGIMNKKCNLQRNFILMFFERMKVLLWKELGWQKSKIIRNLVTDSSLARLMWVITSKW